MAKLTQHLEDGVFDSDRPWDALWSWALDGLSLEGQEHVLSLMLEPYGALVDDLASQMTTDERSGFRIDGTQTCAFLLEAIETSQAWTTEFDFAEGPENARFWYVSEAKLEPRLGERFKEPGAEKEQPLDVARAICALVSELRETQCRTVAEFLRDTPEHRHTVRRVQRTLAAPYATIRDNLIADKMLPIDMLRCKLAFFGATRFDPRSDRWVRIALFQGAPFPNELHSVPDDDWILPFAETVPA